SGRLRNAHIIKLIKNADKILSCNSGASLEALILGKDVSCFGKSEWYEITNKIENYTDLEEVFTSSPKLELTSFQKKYLTYLLKYYWVRSDDISTIKKILAKHVLSLATQNDSSSDIYSELTANLLDKQIELTNSRKKIELVEKDFIFMQEILNYFRRRPWKILKYYLKNRIIKLKKRK
ncbi:capsular polysaccharide export protein, LipB/KpsS family, partial [Acinetobacter pittii]|uniref:capsular polysaccharide export protein, LipB/KpsS family n=1 Tax=Acinetobacter pittii TaxID=48296 RepID=UPI0005C44FDC